MIDFMKFIALVVSIISIFMGSTEFAIYLILVAIFLTLDQINDKRS